MAIQNAKDAAGIGEFTRDQLTAGRTEKQHQEQIKTNYPELEEKLDKFKRATQEEKTNTADAVVKYIQAQHAQLLSQQKSRAPALAPASEQEQPENNNSAIVEKAIQYLKSNTNKSVDELAKGVVNILDPKDTLETALKQLKVNITHYLTLRPKTGFRYWLSKKISWFTRATRVEAAETLQTDLNGAQLEQIDILKTLLNKYTRTISDTQHDILPSKNDKSKTIVNAIENLQNVMKLKM